MQADMKDAKLYYLLDRRSTTKYGAHPVKLVAYYKSKQSLISIGYYFTEEQWNVVQDRKRVIPEMFLSYNVSLDRLCSPTFYCRQKKALHDKTKGVCVCGYNKRAEIEQESEKYYILDFYKHPKKLYRLEVHLNSQEIRDYFTSRRLEQELDVVFNKKLLTEMFYYHLGAVIRFTNGRKKIDWRDIIEDK